MRKYIDHVGEEEGVDFLSPLYYDRFTDEEWAALQELR